ncbi:MAG TPA: biosynthetic-type acetolactate synthase large subunit [Patescibacteria group bacterium]|nr:biosynthetic-type acetolactate synthase large subunit [Patescibacteria group bacterium]
MKMTGAQIIVNCLQECGVDTVFGYPGGQVIPLYDALYDSALRHILPVHEQGAVHAADGYARVNGRTGVCIATSGPGATNIVTGIATAYMDSVPMVIVTGQVPTGQIGRDAFQEIDIVSVTLAMTKHSFQVTDVQHLAPTLRQAFQIAADGRPGPVLVDIPSDIQRMETEYHPLVKKEDKTPITRTVDHKAHSWQKDLAAAMAILHKARQPVMMVGGGVIRSHSEALVNGLAEKAGIPVVSTLMGLGIFGAKHPLYLGLTGMHGHMPANRSIVESDVILAIGCRFSERVTGDRTRYAVNKTVIHIDIDPAEVDKNVVAQVALIGSMPAILEQMTAAIASTIYSDWWQWIRRWQEEYRQACSAQDLFAEQRPQQLSAPWIMRYVSRFLQGQDVVYVTDVGQHQFWAAQHLELQRGDCWLTSGGCGTMGFGLPAAIGAQLAAPEKTVVHIAGDGGFKMTGMELYTAVEQQLPIISLVVNNRSLGMVKQWQQLFFQARYSSTLLPEFDFVTFAHACGAEAEAVTNQADFAKAFSRALACRKAFVLIADIPAEDLVTPMIAPGSCLDQYVEVESRY